MRLCKAYRPRTKARSNPTSTMCGTPLSGTMMKPASAWAQWNEEVARHRTHGTHGETVSASAPNATGRRCLACRWSAYLVVSALSAPSVGMDSSPSKAVATPCSLRLQAPGERVELAREYGRWRRARYRRGSGRLRAREAQTSRRSPKRRNGVSGRGALRAAG